MEGEMTRKKAIQIVVEASEAYKQATTRKDVEEIMIQYGKYGIGYKPLCRVFFSQMSPDRAVRAYWQLMFNRFTKRKGDIARYDHSTGYRFNMR